MNPRYRLIVLDIDGTIQSNDYPLADRTRRAVSLLVEAGAVVTIATGRMFKTAKMFASELNVNFPIISFQGAHIADPVRGKVLWHRPLTREMVIPILEALHGWEGEVLAYHDDNVYVNMLTPWVEEYGQRNPGSVQVVGDLTTLAHEEITRLAVAVEDVDFDRLRFRLETVLDPHPYITKSLPHLCEILHPGAGKHKALSWLQRHLGIPACHTVAFGNGREDVQMLNEAGLGVTVEGGEQAALAIADVVAAPLEDDGPARVMEELLNQGAIG